MDEDRANLTAVVAIVGFGPVGKLLAIQLGQRGRDVVVVDRQVSAYPLPRAVTHCSDFARILQSVGLAPDKIPDITQPYDDLYIWRNAARETLLAVDWSGQGESGWHNTYFFHQPSLERRLDEIVDGLASVRVLRGWDAVGVSQSASDATLHLVSTQPAGEARVNAQWVVGADGANSSVRRWAGIDWHDEGYFYDWLVVDVKPRPEVRFPHVATQSCDVRRPVTMVPGGPGRRRWEFMRLPSETAESLNRTGRAWELLAPYGLTPDNAELERHSVYTFQACWATRWRAGRLLLAGDAAHLMPPFAGQGLGAGVRDVMNLAWKLDAVLRGLADDSLLDTYDAERLRHAIAFIQFSKELGQVICVADPAEASARDARMIADWNAGRKPPAPPRPGLGPGLHTGTAGGQLARQGRIKFGGGTPVLFDDAFHGPGAVIARSGEPLQGLPDEQRELLAALGIDIVGLSGPPSAGTSIVGDADGAYAAWLDELDADVVFVRPDFHLYGAAPADAALELVAGFCAGLRSRKD
jgi:3-(3-hydroxy-phenyl)propionate hydroxylase